MEETLTKPRYVAALASALTVFLMVLAMACSEEPAVTEPVDTPVPSLEEAATPEATPPTQPEFPTSAVEPDERRLPPPEVPEELSLIWEVWDRLLNDYVDRDQLDPETMTEAAIRGLLSVLEDPQTSYVRPEVLQGSFQDTFRGNFEGIGANVQMNARGALLIVSPIEGGPAEKAGLKAGDTVLAVDGESIEGLSLLEAVAIIRGPDGTTVNLLIKRLGQADPFDVSVVRGVIPLQSVYLRTEPTEPFAHIRISNFYPTTVPDLKATLSMVQLNGAKGVILDMRDNPGGTLASAVDIASQFLTEGIVVYVVDGNGRRTDWDVREGGLVPDLPLVVLVNEGSASASEVVTGALQDYERATIIGTTSFGKGSVNILRQLSNGGGLYLTSAFWYTPDGRLIQHEGITPDIEVTGIDDREEDVNQLRRAYAELEAMTGVSARSAS